MTGGQDGGSEDWTETDILPFDPARKEALLLGVVDPLINAALSKHVESWHYFWEIDPIRELHLRLRVLWRPGQGDEGRAELTAFLDEARAAGVLRRWYTGSHGVLGEEYPGEADDYDGLGVWPATYRDWRAGSDLSLALLKLDAAGRLEHGRQHHLERRVHLHSNRLGLTYRDEGVLYLGLAIGYLRHAGLSGEALRVLSQVKDAIDRVP